MNESDQKFLQPEQHVGLFDAEPWRRVLWEAAELIERRGWCQYTAEDQQLRVCAIGAIGIAHVGDAFKPAEGNGYKAEMHLANAVRDRAEYAEIAISMWNNASERTAAEVIAKLREVALS